LCRLASSSDLILKLNVLKQKLKCLNRKLTGNRSFLNKIIDAGSGRLCTAHPTPLYQIYLRDTIKALKIDPYSGATMMPLGTLATSFSCSGLTAGAEMKSNTQP